MAENTPTIVVIVEGGCFQTLRSTVPINADVTLVDYDNIKQGDPHPFGSDDAMDAYVPYEIKEDTPFCKMQMFDTFIKQLLQRMEDLYERSVEAYERRDVAYGDHLVRAMCEIRNRLNDLVMKTCVPEVYEDIADAEDIKVFIAKIGSLFGVKD
jgi:hypothetical protein